MIQLARPAAPSGTVVAYAAAWLLRTFDVQFRLCHRNEQLNTDTASTEHASGSMAIVSAAWRGTVVSCVGLRWP